MAELAWTAARDGARQLLLIGGEPGAGKSRLAEEIAGAVHRQGAVVLAGSCPPGPSRPYAPFVDCIEQLFRDVPEGAIADVIPDSAAELLRLTPLVCRHRPDLIAPQGQDDERRTELFDAFADLLIAVAAEQPLLCVLDDLHWAGAPARQLLTYVTRRVTGARLFILATHRSTEPDRSSDLADTIADLYRLDGVRRVDLTGLNTDEVFEYLIMEGGMPPRRARSLAPTLRDRTGGNPFFLREVLRDDMSATPLSVRDTLGRRMAALSSHDRGALEAAAVLGNGGDLRVLAEACGEPVDQILSAAEVAARFGLLDPGDLLRGRIGFPHNLTRTAVVDLIDPLRRAKLHASIGEAIESLTGSGELAPRVVRELAYHFAQAATLGYGEQAARYLVPAAQAAERGLAFEDAASWYEQAADLTGAPESQRSELLAAAAQNHTRAGDFGGARALYRRLGDSADPVVRLRAAFGFEDAAWRPGTCGDEACQLLTRALEAVTPDPADVSYVAALASLGRATAFTGDTDRARSIGETALTYARELGDNQLLIHVLQTIMWHSVDPGSVDSHLALAEELTTRATVDSDWGGLGTAAVFRSLISYIKSDLSGWEDAARDMDRSVRGSGQPFMTYMRRCTDFARSYLHGDFAAAEQIADDLVELGSSFGPDDTEGPYGLQLFMLRRETGGLDQVRHLVGPADQTNSWEPGLLALHTEFEDVQATRRLLWRLLDRDAAAHQAPWAQATAVLVFLVEAAVMLGDVAAARRLRPMLAPYSGTQLVAGQFVAMFGPADLYLALLDSVLGDYESADHLFAAAVADSSAVGSTVHLALTLAAWAKHCDRGSSENRSRADALRERARQLATSHNLVRIMRMLEPAHAVPAGLTAREFDVLRLLVAGKSNRDIAGALRITENTTANHVRSILSKTGATNRTQVATMALAGQWLDRPTTQAIRAGNRLP